mgnify:CR=1 FL=1
MRSRFFLLFLFLFFINISFAAILETTNAGKLVGEVVLIDKSGVAVVVNGTTRTIKPENVKYVLLDESRTDLVGTKGIVLNNGSTVYGEPSNITRNDGLITNQYGAIKITLDNVVYFTYEKNTDIEDLMKNLSAYKYADMFINPDFNMDKVVVYLANNTSFVADSVKINISGAEIIYTITSGNITYILKPGYITVLLYPREDIEGKFFVELKSGVLLYGQLTFAQENVILDDGYENRFVVKFSDVSRIVNAESMSVRSNIVSHGLEVVNSFVDGNVLRIQLLTDKLYYNGKEVEKIELNLGN